MMFVFYFIRLKNNLFWLMIWGLSAIRVKKNQ